VVAGLNAIRRQLHYPIDFETRLETINKVANLKPEISDFTENVLFWRAVLINALFMYQNIDDLSMQTASSRLILMIVKCIPINTDAYKQLISGVIMTQVRKMLKHRNEKFRFEFVRLLQDIVGQFPDDSDFGPLKALQDENLELDFFVNITHLQHHRRQRAFKLG
jgi:U3 small nucleolar RNA-associated protein 20